MAEGKRSRKHGNNKVACTRYKNEYREERNRKRKVRRHENAVAKKAMKIEARIKAGKPVHERHINAALKEGTHVHLRLLNRRGDRLDAVNAKVKARTEQEKKKASSIAALVNDLIAGTGVTV